MYKLDVKTHFNLICFGSTATFNLFLYSVSANEVNWKLLTKSLVRDLNNNNNNSNSINNDKAGENTFKRIQLNLEEIKKTSFQQSYLLNI